MLRSTISRVSWSSQRSATRLVNDSPRSFHASPHLLTTDSYNPEDVVPNFYLQRKRQKLDAYPDPAQSAAIKQRKSEESNLMERLSDSILSDEVAASTHSLEAKVPTELHNELGQLVHPSGFVIPTPGDAPDLMSEHRARNAAAQTFAVLERVLEEDHLAEVSAEIRSREGKVPAEVTDKEGRIIHPSGFIPPTPQQEFVVSKILSSSAASYKGLR